MKKIRRDKFSIVGIALFYIAVAVFMWFISKNDINYTNNIKYIVLSIIVIIAVIHTVLALGKYVAYNEDELIIHTMFIGTKRVKFSDIKYIKTETRRTKTRIKTTNVTSSITIWIITLINSKKIKVNIGGLDGEDIKAFKNELNNKHKNIIIKTPEIIQ